MTRACCRGFVPMAEAMVAIVLADHWLRWKGQIGGP